VEDVKEKGIRLISTNAQTAMVNENVALVSRDGSLGTPTHVEVAAVKNMSRSIRTGPNARFVRGLVMWLVNTYLHGFSCECAAVPRCQARQTAEAVQTRVRTALLHSRKNHLSPEAQRCLASV